MMKMLPRHERVRSGREWEWEGMEGLPRGLTKDEAGSATQQVHETRHQILHEREDGLEG